MAFKNKYVIIIIIIIINTEHSEIMVPSFSNGTSHFEPNI